MLDPITLGLGGSALGGLMGLFGGLGRKTLDFGTEQGEMRGFANTARDRSNDMYGYGKDFMNSNSGWYTGALANMGRQSDVMMNSMRNQSAVGLGANAYNRMMNNLRRQAMDSTMGQFSDLYSKGAGHAANMFGLSKDYSGQQLGAMQIGAAMKEKQWESENAGPEAWQKAGMGLLGTFAGSMLGNDKIWGSNAPIGGANGGGGGSSYTPFDFTSWGNGGKLSEGYSGPQPKPFFP